jgi:hypothetical protein
MKVLVGEHIFKEQKIQVSLHLPTMAQYQRRPISSAFKSIHHHCIIKSKQIFVISKHIIYVSAKTN